MACTQVGEVLALCDTQVGEVLALCKEEPVSEAPVARRHTDADYSSGHALQHIDTHSYHSRSLDVNLVMQRGEGIVVVIRVVRRLLLYL